MKENINPLNHKVASLRNIKIGTLAIILLLLMLTSCSIPNTGTNIDESTLKTQMAMEVQMTLLAEQSSKGLAETAAAQQETLVAQGIQMTTIAQQSAQLTQQAQQPNEPTPDYIATQNAMSAEATASALMLTQQAELQVQATPEATPAPTEPLPTAAPDVDAFLKSANILLYEDMAGVYDTTRFVKEALDTMGLEYVDTKDAVGRFKEQLLTLGPGGQGWDIVIAAGEARTAVRGEMFDYLSEALTAGSSVIIETWILESQSAGRVATILGRCGIEFQSDWFNVPTDRQVIYPLDATHPVLHDPNDGIQFRITNYWSLSLGTFAFDYGDILRKATGSDAIMVMGTHPTEKSSYGVLAVCLDDRLIFQTFPTHGYRREHMVRLWINYIYNAAKARMQYLAANP